MYILLSAGHHGRCLLVGRTEAEPVMGQSVTLYDARLILRFRTGGALGIAASGPRAGSTLTETVPQTTETVWQEWTLCTEAAETALRGWPSV